MQDKPDFVLRFQETKPKGTEIKHIGNHWYLYSLWYEYDPKTRRTLKKSGTCLGKITPGGLVKTTHRLAPDGNCATDIVSVGGFVYFYERSAPMRQRLKRLFPDIWRKIYTAVYIRTFHSPRLQHGQTHYEDSLASHVFPRLSINDSSIRNFLAILGRRREAISRYMKLGFDPADTFLIFDGRRILAEPGPMPGQPGHDPLRNKPGIGLLYLCALGQRVARPAYYKQFQAAEPDAASHAALLDEISLVRDRCTLAAAVPPGSFLPTDLPGLPFLMPLPRDNPHTRGRIPADPRGYTKAFSYGDETILSVSFPVWESVRGERIPMLAHLYHDPDLHRAELAEAGTSHSRPPAAPPGMGTVVILTNRTELSPEQVYRMYRRRQSISRFFHAYSDELAREPHCTRPTEHEAWLFLNHLSLEFCAQEEERLAEAGLGPDISFDGLRHALVNVHAFKVPGAWVESPPKPTAANLCEKLGIRITAEEIARVFDSA